MGSNIRAYIGCVYAYVLTSRGLFLLFSTGDYERVIYGRFFMYSIDILFWKYQSIAWINCIEIHNVTSKKIIFFSFEDILSVNT